MNRVIDLLCNVEFAVHVNTLWVMWGTFDPWLFWLQSASCVKKLLIPVRYEPRTDFVVLTKRMPIPARDVGADDSNNNHRVSGCSCLKYFSHFFTSVARKCKFASLRDDRSVGQLMTRIIAVSLYCTALHKKKKGNLICRPRNERRLYVMYCNYCLVTSLCSHETTKEIFPLRHRAVEKAAAPAI